MSIVTPTSVYLYYDQHDILIYVGITSRGVRRNIEHNITKDWWQFVTRQGVEHYPSRTEALARERELIEKHCPPFNTQHNRAANEVRRAYLLFTAADRQPTSLRDALRAMQHQLPLAVHDLGEHPTVVLRTRVDDAAIAGVMRLPEGEKPRVFGMSKKNGRVLKVEKHGPVALIHLGSTKNHPIEDAYAVVKFDQKQQLTLRNIHVRLDHSDPRRCDRNCPQRPKVRWIRPDGEGAA